MILPRSLILVVDSIHLNLIQKIICAWSKYFCTRYLVHYMQVAQMWRPLSFPSPDKLKIFSRIFFTPRLCKNISQLRSAKRISIFYTFSYSGCSAVELLISRKGWKGKIKKMKLEEKSCLVDYSAKGSSINSDADHHSDILMKKFKMSQKSLTS